MTAKNYDTCLRESLAHEGGFVHHPKDPGGATNFGVTQRTYDAHRKQLGNAPRSVKDIEWSEVLAIYRTYWTPVWGDKLPAGIDHVQFDASINSGPNRAVKLMQKALASPRVAVDGKMGSKTLDAIKGYTNGPQLIERACSARMAFLRGLGTFTTFGRGWSRRVATVEATAVRMWFAAMRVGADTARVDMEIRARTARARATVDTKNATATATASAGGGGGLSALDGVPVWVIVAVVAVLGIVAVQQLRRAKFQKERARAFAALTEGG